MHYFLGDLAIYLIQYGFFFGRCRRVWLAPSDLGGFLSLIRRLSAQGDCVIGVSFLFEENGHGIRVDLSNFPFDVFSTTADMFWGYLFYRRAKGLEPLGLKESHSWQEWYDAHQKSDHNINTQKG